MGEEIWLDPNHEEANAGASTLVLACMPALNVVTNVWQNGTMSPTQGLEVGFTTLRVLFPHFARPTVSDGLPRAVCNDPFNRRPVSRLEFRARVDQLSRTNADQWMDGASEGEMRGRESVCVM